MGQVLHGSATTTEGVRRAIQARQESVREGRRPATRSQSDHRAEVALAPDQHGRAHGTEGAALKRAERRGRGCTVPG